jgi:hypothetical protein
VIDQEPLKRPGHVPAIFNHPDALVIERPRRHQEQAEAVLHRRFGPLGKLAAQRIRRDQRVVALVGVCPDHDHLRRPFV